MWLLAIGGDKGSDVMVRVLQVWGFKGFGVKG